VFKLPGLVAQLVPSYSSVAPVLGGDIHQKLTQLFEYQQPAKSVLAVFKLPGDVVQVEPSYSSVAPVRPGAEPPKPKAAVCVPATC
jgi:hypothetical protein